MTSKGINTPFNYRAKGYKTLKSIPIQLSCQRIQNNHLQLIAINAPKDTKQSNQYPFNYRAKGYKTISKQG